MMPLNIKRITHRLRRLIFPAVLALASLFISCGDMYSDLVETKKSLLASLGISYTPYIAFASFRDSNYEIYVMDPDGENQTNITNNPSEDRYPAWSPDNTKIAFASDRDTGNWQIYVMNADGSGQTRLTDNGAFDSYPSWSNDGSHIVFQSTRDGGSEIYVMDANGDNETRLTNNPASDRYPVYMPDGGRIAFYRDNLLYIMNANGTGETLYSDDIGLSGRFSFSPDGARIVYQTFGNDINIINADGSGLANISTGGFSDNYPCWSSDGSRIIFYTNRDGNYNIYSMLPDGSDLVPLTDDPGLDIDPAYSRNGKRPVTTVFSRVYYNGNGNEAGSPPVDSNGYSGGQAVTVLGNTGSLVRNGYSFTGWNTFNDGSGTHYDPGDGFTMGAGSTTLYAEWTANDYFVYYDANGASGGSPPATGTYHINDTVTVQGNPGTLVRSLYIFSGWNTQSDGLGTHYNSGNTFIMGTADVTLFAEWTYSPFVAVGGSGARIRSTDAGVNWTDYQTGGTDALYGIAYGNNYYVAVGYANGRRRSLDGKTWTNAAGGGTTMNGIAFGNGYFVAVGNGGRRIRTTDGVGWADEVTGGNTLRGVAYGNGVFVAVGDGATIWRSTDTGLSWTDVSPATQNLYSVAFGNNVFVAVGNSGVRIRSVNNGVNWIDETSGGGLLRGIAYGNGVFVAVGDGGTIRRSTDNGLSWTDVSPGGGILYAVAYGNNVFIAVGEGGRRIRSIDGGITWIDEAMGSVTYIGVCFGPQ